MSKFHEPYNIIRTFLSITKELPDQFERKRMWGPRSLMIWLMLLTFPDRKTSYRRCLPVLKGFAQRAFGWIKMPSIGSITPARAKMLPSECRSMLRMVIDRCEKYFGQVEHRYGKRRFIAFDGTRLITPRSHDTVIKLHRYKGPGGKKTHYPQGFMVTAVDVFRRLPLDWIFVGKGTGERTAMKGLLDTLSMKAGDVAIMDRGLPSRKLFGLLLERGVDIVARMSTQWRSLYFPLKNRFCGRLHTRGNDRCGRGLYAYRRISPSHMFRTLVMSSPLHAARSKLSIAPRHIVPLTFLPSANSASRWSLRTADKAIHAITAAISCSIPSRVCA
jgi:hypothetical protein